MPKSTGERWMGVPEAAEYLGVVIRTVYRLIDTGEIRAFRVGRVRMRREDVDAFLESQQLQPGELGHLYPPLMGTADGEDEAE